MKTFRNYVHKNNKINEGVLSSIRDKVGAGFKKIGKAIETQKIRWIDKIMAAQKAGLLSKAVKIFDFGNFANPQNFKIALKKESGIEKRHYIHSYDQLRKFDRTIIDSVIEGDLMSEDSIATDSPDSSVPDVDANKLKRMIKNHYYNGDVLFIWGATGIGKSQIAEQVARELGIMLIVIDLSLREPVDFLGIPDIVKGRTVFRLPAIFPIIDKEDPDPAIENGGIIFFDEFNNADQSVHKASFRLILDGKLEHYELPPKWAVMVAGNRSIDNPGVTPIEIPLKNRFSHVNYTPDIKSFTKWSEKEFVDEDGESIMEPTIISFLTHLKPDYLHKASTEEHNFPTPRAWATVSKNIRILEKREKRKLSIEEKSEIIGARVGPAVAAEWENYANLVDSFKFEDIKKIFTDYKNAPLPHKEKGSKVPGTTQYTAYKLDHMHALISAAESIAKKKKLNAKEFGEVVDYSIRLNNAEGASYLIRAVMRNNLHLRQDQKALEHFKRWTKKYQMDLQVDEWEEVKK